MLLAMILLLTACDWKAEIAKAINENAQQAAPMQTTSQTVELFPDVTPSATPVPDPTASSTPTQTLPPTPALPTEYNASSGVVYELPEIDD